MYYTYLDGKKSQQHETFADALKQFLALSSKKMNVFITREYNNDIYEKYTWCVNKITLVNSKGKTIDIGTYLDDTAFFYYQCMSDKKEMVITPEEESEISTDEESIYSVDDDIMKNLNDIKINCVTDLKSKLEFEGDESRRKQFQCDLKIYNTLKREIESGEKDESEISEIFKPKYLIFSVMDIKGDLYSENAEFIYSDMYFEHTPSTKKTELDSIFDMN